MAGGPTLNQLTPPRPLRAEDHHVSSPMVASAVTRGGSRTLPLPKLLEQAEILRITNFLKTPPDKVSPSPIASIVDIRVKRYVKQLKTPHIAVALALFEESLNQLAAEATEERTVTLPRSSAEELAFATGRMREAIAHRALTRRIGPDGKSWYPEGNVRHPFGYGFASLPSDGGGETPTATASTPMTPVRMHTHSGHIHYESPGETGVEIHPFEQDAKNLTATISLNFLNDAGLSSSAQQDVFTNLAKQALHLMEENNHREHDTLTYHWPPHAAEMFVDTIRQLAIKSREWVDLDEKQKKHLVMLGALSAAYHDAYFSNLRGIDESICADALVRQLGLADQFRQADGAVDEAKEAAKTHLVRMIHVMIVGGTLPVFSPPSVKPATMLAEISTLSGSDIPADVSKALLDVAHTLAGNDVHRTETAYLRSKERVAAFNTIVAERFGSVAVDTVLPGMTSDSAAGAGALNVVDQLRHFAKAALAEVGLADSNDNIEALFDKLGQNLRMMLESGAPLPDKPSKLEMPVEPEQAEGQSHAEYHASPAYQEYTAKCGEYAIQQEALERYEARAGLYRAYLTAGANIAAGNAGSLPSHDLPTEIFEKFKGESAFLERLANAYRVESGSADANLWDAHRKFLIALYENRTNANAQQIIQWAILRAGCQDGAKFAKVMKDPAFSASNMLSAIMDNPHIDTDYLLRASLAADVTERVEVVVTVTDASGVPPLSAQPGGETARTEGANPASTAPLPTAASSAAARDRSASPMPGRAASPSVPPVMAVVDGSAVPNPAHPVPRHYVGKAGQAHMARPSRWATVWNAICCRTAVVDEAATATTATGTVTSATVTSVPGLGRTDLRMGRPAGGETPRFASQGSNRALCERSLHPAGTGAEPVDDHPAGMPTL